MSASIAIFTLSLVYGAALLFDKRRESRHALPAPGVGPPVVALPAATKELADGPYRAPGVLTSRAPSLEERLRNIGSSVQLSHEQSVSYLIYFYDDRVVIRLYVDRVIAEGKTLDEALCRLEQKVVSYIEDQAKRAQGALDRLRAKDHA